MVVIVKNLKIERLSRVGLLIAALLWGISFVPQKIAMEYCGPLEFNAARFLIPAVLLGGFSLLRNGVKALGKRGFLGSCMLLGTLLFLGSALQQVGMLDAGAAHTGFITGLYLVLVPILLRLFWHEPAGPHVWCGALFSLIGLGLLCLKSDFHLMPGDGWVLACAFAYSFHVIAVARLGAKFDAIELSAGQYLVCGLLNLIFAYFFESGLSAGLLSAWREIAFMVIGSTCIAYTIQIVAQPHVDTRAATLILGLESVFSAVAGWYFLGELMSRSQMAGCFCMVLGVLIVEKIVWPKRWNFGRVPSVSTVG